MCKSLLAYHALTGCDYTSSFCRRGKVNPLKVLEKDTEAQHALGNMACGEDLNNECIKTLERYLCDVYGKNKLNEINDVRLQIFLEKYRPRCGEEYRPKCGVVLSNLMEV